MSEVLRRLGCDVAYERTPGSGGGGRVVIDVPEKPSTETDYDLVRRMRASISVLGPAGRPLRQRPGGAARRRRDRLPRPGHAHLRAGAARRRRSSASTASSSPRARGCPAPRSGWTSRASGATENLLMAAVLARGTTVIDNAAREPEIVDLCSMLAAMGARIDGAGTSTITVEGVDALTPVELHDRADRIVAGTWAVGAVMTRGRRRHRAGRGRAPDRRAGQAGRRGRRRSRRCRTGSGSRWTAGRAASTS